MTRLSLNFLSFFLHHGPNITKHPKLLIVLIEIDLQTHLSPNIQAWFLAISFQSFQLVVNELIEKVDFVLCNRLFKVWTFQNVHKTLIELNIQTFVAAKQRETLLPTKPSIGDKTLDWVLIVAFHRICSLIIKSKLYWSLHQILMAQASIICSESLSLLISTHVSLQLQVWYSQWLSQSNCFFFKKE